MLASTSPAPQNTKTFVYQIFYNQETKTEFRFYSLDNTANERPDWYEF